MKVAIVCDWLTDVGGAEKVLLKIHKLYPDAPIYTSKYDSKGIDWFEGADVRTGSLQKFPTWMRRILGPLRQGYFSKLDLSEYDLVISVTGAEAKAVKAPNGIHISYCHVPTQYYWQMYDEYIKNPGFGILNPIARLVFRIVVKPLKRADLKSAQVPDYFVTISDYAKEMIRKYYGRDAVVIHPPVETKDFEVRKGNSGDIACPSDTLQGRSGQSLCSEKHVISPEFPFPAEDYYITTSRQVNWKKIDLAVKACMMTQRRLLVIGDGSEHKKLVRMAKGTELIKFLPIMTKHELAFYLQNARGYLFPSLEPFGIAPVEALAAGCPVIAYGVGGAKDYVIEGKNGVLFKEQTAKSLAEAILRFEKMKFSSSKVAKTADGFSEDRFDTELKNFVKKCMNQNEKKKKE